MHGHGHYCGADRGAWQTLCCNRPLHALLLRERRQAALIARPGAPAGKPKGYPMPDYPFDPQSGRRRTVEEAAGWVEQTYGYTLVNGCQTVLDAAGVQHNTR